MLQVVNVKICEILLFALATGTCSNNQSWSTSNFKTRIRFGNEFKCRACPFFNAIFNIFLCISLDFFVVKVKIVVRVENFIRVIHLRDLIFFGMLKMINNQLHTASLDFFTHLNQLNYALKKSVISILIHNEKVE
jgi:hypothetical protein